MQTFLLSAGNSIAGKRVILCNTQYPIFTGFSNIENRAWLGYVPVEVHQIRELLSSGE